MHIEVDQSIRIDNTQKDTIIAFSNEISAAVRIPAPVKRKCLKILRSRGAGKRNIYLKLFSAALSILLRPYARQVNTITIDTEFSDKQSQQFIKTILLKNLRRSGSKLSVDDITFSSIGKKSRAHLKAYGVHKRKTDADYTAKMGKILELV